MRLIKRFFRSLVYFSAIVSLISGAVHLLRVRSARSLILRGLKAFAEGLSPFLAIAGAVSSLFSLLINAPWAALIGVSGALLNARYVRNVTRPHHAFEDPFGEDWQVRLAQMLSPQQSEALLRRRWTWRMPRPRHVPAWERDMIYHVAPAQNGLPEIPLRCDLWLPPERVARSGIALLYIHGGGFFTSAKDFGTRSFFRHLVSQGHMAMDINYRLGPQASLFEMISDVLHAVAWLKDNAELFGAQPDRVVLVGGSAGGQLALLAAYAHDNPHLKPSDLQDIDLSVRAVVSYYGVIDMAAAFRRMQSLFQAIVRRPVSDELLNRPVVRRALTAAAWVRGVEVSALREYVRQNQEMLSVGLEAGIQQLVGGSPDQVPDIYRLVSPISYAGPACPPTLLFQGDHDYLLPSSVTRKLHQALRSAGVPSVFIELPETEHIFDQFLPEISPPAQVALYDLERFLALIA